MATAGRSSWKTRALACAGAAAIAFVAILGVRWERTGAQSDDEDSAPAVKRAAIALPAPETPPPLSGNDSSISAQPGHLILTGTLVAADPADSRAFLGTDPKNPQTYALNSMLVNGTRIQAIARDHVMLERDGRVARLDIGGAWSEPSPTARPLTEIAAMAAESAATPEPRAPQLTDALRISPVFDASGILTSYRLRPGRQGALFAPWGLQSGDQLVAIEGAPLADTDSAAYLLELIAGGERVHATVLRNGTRVPVLLDGSVIAEGQSRAQAANSNEMSAPPG